MKPRIPTLLFALLFLPLSMAVAASGKIAGKVVDQRTGESIPGVNIVLVGTSHGAATNIDGEYTILNLPPGTYELKASAIGYTSVTIRNVKVSIDLTTRINVSLSETVLELDNEVVITAERPLVQKDLTASTAVVGAEEISSLPVTEVNDVLKLQAGYINGHVRGGRRGELAYWIDGVPVTDVYDGGSVVDVNKDQVQELQLISGAFNAEYGQANSGIVNIATKEGASEFRGTLGAYIGGYASGNTNIFPGIDDLDPLTVQNYEGSLSGPLVSNRISFVATGRYSSFGGWLSGFKRYEPFNVGYIDSAGTVIRFRDPSGMGDSSKVRMNDSRRIYGQAKLSFRISEAIKFWAQYIHDDVISEDYNSFFKFNPEGNPKNYRLGSTVIGKLTHLLSNSTFYELSGSLFEKDFRRHVYENPHDPRYVHPNLLQSLPYSYSWGGVDMVQFHRTTRTLALKFDFTTQLNQRHLIKAGATFNTHSLYYNDFQLRPIDAQGDFDYATGNPFITTQIPGIETILRQEYTRTPVEFSFYLQDKMEFDDLIINVGVRYDGFMPEGQILADPSDPNIYDPIRPENRYRDVNGNGVQDQDEPVVTLAERQTYWYKEARYKQQVSPRIGAAFPITDRGVLHFSYGHFFMLPRFELLYANSLFKIGNGTGNQGTVGNADLEPEMTVNAEIGLQQQLTDDLSVDATVYVRDARDLAGTRADQINVFGGFATYSRIINSDFAMTRGLVLSLNKRFGDGLAASLDYTFQIARGTASDPYAAQQAAARGDLPEVQLTSLGWDQRHSVNASVSYNGPSYGGSVVMQYGSGMPYTPRRSDDITSLITNSLVKPNTLNVDVRLFKSFALGFTNMNVYLRVFNLFDVLNELDVYDDTGRSGYTTDVQRILAQNPRQDVNTIQDFFTRPWYYSEPRRVEIGANFEF